MDLQELSDKLFNEIYIEMLFEWDINYISIDRLVVHFYHNCTCHSFMYLDECPPGIIWHRDNPRDACLPHRKGWETA